MSTANLTICLASTMLIAIKMPLPSNSSDDVIRDFRY